MRAKFEYPAHFTDDAMSLINQLLSPKATRRLGVVKGGVGKIKQHAFFKGLDWGKLESRDVPPPIVPVLAHGTDLSAFADMADEEEPGGEGLPYTDTSNWEKDF